MQPETYLNIKEAAALLKVHENTVRNWLNRGDLPGVKLGNLWRISAAAVDALIAGTPPAKEEEHDHTDTD